MNILTIDFDWVMGNSIVAYNDEIDTFTTEEDWEYIRKTRPGVDFTPNWELFK